jgi:hypothetical protein
MVPIVRNTAAAQHHVNHCRQGGAGGFAVIAPHHAGGPSRAAPFHPAKRRCGRYAAGGEDEDGDGEGEDGRGEGGWNVKDGDGDDGDGDGDGLGEGLGFGLGLGDGFDEGKVADTAGAGSSAGGVVAVSAAGDEADTVILGDGLADGFGEDEDGGTGGADGWSEICCTAATERAEARGPGARTARAVPAAAITAIALIAMAAFHPQTRRNRGIRSTVLPCSAGGAPAGHSAASSSAASPSCERPRWCQSRP